MELCWPGGEVMQSTCSHFCYASNAFWLGLCGPGGASASPLYASVLSEVSYSRVVNFSCEGEKSQE